MRLAVVLHSRKSLGGGPGELRDLLTAAGHPSPLWFEVAKSKQVPECIAEARAEGADLVLLWGGDGTVQRGVHAAAGTGLRLGILPAGTANVLAGNLGIPQDLPAAVEIALHGADRELDTGSVNGEHFATVAGAGLDAMLVDDASGRFKDRLGMVAYLWAGAKNLRASPVEAKVKVDGRRFFRGVVTCVLVGNVRDLAGGTEAFPGAQPDDGLLDLGIVTAKSVVDWTRTLARTATGRPTASPFVVTARGTRFKIAFDHAVPYELDGGARGDERSLRVKVHPASITVRVPRKGVPSS